MSTLSSPLVDTERSLAMLVGMFAGCLNQGKPPTQCELDNHTWLSSQFMRAGCQVIMCSLQFIYEF